MTRGRLLAHAWLQALLWLGIAGAVNHLAAAWPVRLDVTGDQHHSLSPASIAAVATLDQPLTATVWFTEDLGAPYHNHHQAVRDLLAELEASSGGWLDVVERDPTGDTEAQGAAARAGIRPVTWALRERDQTVARQVWMGVSFDHGTRHAAVDALPRIDRMEHDLLRAILAVTTPADARKTVGWWIGHGEPRLDGWPADHPMARLGGGLRARYDVVEVDRTPIPDEVDALIVVGPQQAVPGPDQAELDRFVMRGGTTALYLTGWQPDFERMALRQVDHEMGPLLETWGVSLGGDLLLDRKRNEAMVVPVGGQLARVSYPLAPVSTAFDRAWAPVRDLRQAVLPFTSSVLVTASGPVEGQVWLATEATSRSTRSLGSLRIEALRSPLVDERPGPHPVMVAAEGRFASHFPEDGAGQSAPTRLVVAGSADMVANNPELVLNSVDWLLSDPRLVGVRSKGTGPAPLVVPARPWVWKLAVAGGPFAALLGIGLWFGIRRRRR